MSIFGIQNASFLHEIRCLVVGDIEAMRKTTVGQLRQLGVEQIRVVRNDVEALRALDTQVFDIVLADWNMPGEPGINLLKAVRASKSVAAMPVVLMTAEAERSRVEEAITSGVTSVLLKPHSSNQLLHRLERAHRERARGDGRPALRPGPGREAGPPAGEGGAAGASARPAILIVDDTPKNLALLSHLFEGDFHLILAQTGAQAIEALDSGTPPDLVLLDIMMPGMDGFEVARRLREHPGFAATPIIFLTAVTAIETRLKGLEMGAVDFITKPINLDTLKLRVRNFMRYVQMRKDLQIQFDQMVEMARLREQMENITKQDLKAPLAGVLRVVQSMMEDDSTGRRQIDQARLIEENVLRVLGMVHLSSELYKIESGQFELRKEPIRLGDLLRRIAEMNRVTYAAKSLSIAVDSDVAVGVEPPRAVGDETMCYAIFENLVSHACEMAPASSVVTIRVFDESPLRVVIRNSGNLPVGMSERFFDKPPANAGAGHSAYSSKLMVEAQAGTIALRVDDPVPGIEVKVTLPRLPT